MPPKVKVTKDAIVDMAVEIVRTQGPETLNARNVASALNCSTQPVFSNFATMEELRYTVLLKADALYKEYMRREVESGKYPTYKASGMAYIRFAKEESQLFRLLYMRDRSADLRDIESSRDHSMEQLVQSNTGLTPTESKLFHLEMWAYVHGIATMFATGFLDIEWELVSQMLTDAYQGLRKQYEGK